MNSPYIAWLKRQGVPLFRGANIYWRLYRGALVPARSTPVFVEPGDSEIRHLLRDSQARLIRYSSDPSDYRRDWWYILCDKYDTSKINSKTRSNIKRGHRMCSVKRIDIEWLANQGYECYLAAYTRYKNASAVSEEAFRNSLLATTDGPFEYWGVFVDDRLVGYCKCIVDDKEVCTSETKYHPSYLRHRSAYALVDTLISHYVVDRKMILSNGNRSVAHDTNYQEVLIKLGFRKQYCRLNVFYRPWLKLVVQLLFPLRGIIARLPNRSAFSQLQALLRQDTIKRGCRPGSATWTP